MDALNTFCEGLFCHNWLNLGFSFKLRIWQVPACKMEPQRGIILMKPPTRHPQPIFSNRSNDYWGPVLMCGVPYWPPVQKVCVVPPPPSYWHPVQKICTALSWILSKIENLASSSLQDESKLILYPRVWHS